MVNGLNFHIRNWDILRLIFSGFGCPKYGWQHGHKNLQLEEIHLCYCGDIENDVLYTVNDKLKQLKSLSIEGLDSDLNIRLHLSFENG